MPIRGKAEVMAARMLARLNARYDTVRHPSVQEGGDPIEIIHLDPLSHKRVPEALRQKILRNPHSKARYMQNSIVPENPDYWHAHIMGSVRRLEDFVSKPFDMDKVAQAVTSILHKMKIEMNEPTELTINLVDSDEMVCLQQAMKRISRVNAKGEDILFTTYEHILKEAFGNSVHSGFLKVFVLVKKGMDQIREREFARLGMQPGDELDPKTVRPLSEFRKLALSDVLLRTLANYFYVISYVSWPWHPRIPKKLLALFELVQDKKTEELNAFKKKLYNQIKAYFIEAYKKLPVAEWTTAAKLAQRFRFDPSLTVDSSDEEEAAPSEDGEGAAGKRRSASPSSSSSASSEASEASNHSQKKKKGPAA